MNNTLGAIELVKTKEQGDDGVYSPRGERFIKQSWQYERLVETEPSDEVKERFNDLINHPIYGEVIQVALEHSPILFYGSLTNFLRTASEEEYSEYLENDFLDFTIIPDLDLAANLIYGSEEEISFYTDLLEKLPDGIELTDNRLRKDKPQIVLEIEGRRVMEINYAPQIIARKNQMFKQFGIESFESNNGFEEFLINTGQFLHEAEGVLIEDTSGSREMRGLAIDPLHLTHIELNRFSSYTVENLFKILSQAQSIDQVMFALEFHSVLNNTIIRALKLRYNYDRDIDLLSRIDNQEFNLSNYKFESNYSILQDLFEELKVSGSSLEMLNVANDFLCVLSQSIGLGEERHKIAFSNEYRSSSSYIRALNNHSERLVALEELGFLKHLMIEGCINNEIFDISNSRERLKKVAKHIYENKVTDITTILAYIFIYGYEERDIKRLIEYVRFIRFPRDRVEIFKDLRRDKYKKPSSGWRGDNMNPVISEVRFVELCKYILKIKE